MRIAWATRPICMLIDNVTVFRIVRAGRKWGANTAFMIVVAARVKTTNACYTSLSAPRHTRAAIIAYFQHR